MVGQPHRNAETPCHVGDIGEAHIVPLRGILTTALEKDNLVISGVAAGVHGVLYFLNAPHAAGNQHRLSLGGGVGNQGRVD